MIPPHVVMGLVSGLPWGYSYHRYEGRKRKNTIPWASPPRGRYPVRVLGRRSPAAQPSARLERRHHVAGEPAELLLELLDGEALGPMDHEVFEPGILRGDGLDARDHVRWRTAEPRLLLDAVGQRGHARGRARRAPRATVLVGVTHETEGREPLVAFVVRRLDATLGLLGRVGEVEPGTPDHVLAELFGTAVLRAGVAIRLHHVARVVPAPHAHDHATVGDDVRHRVVLGEADGVPHRDHVEGAAELEAPRLGGEPQRELDEVREALVALALEVMLGRPERVVSKIVHQLGDVARGEERLAQPLVAVAPGVGRRALQADVLQVDPADVEHVESLDHRAVHPPSITSVWPVT